MKAFVFGATGFVGSNIAAALQGAGYQVSGLARSQEAADKLRGQGIVPLIGEIHALADFAEAIKKADVVVYALKFMRDQEHEAVRRILDLMAGSNHTFLMTSGTAVLGRPTAGEFHEDCLAEDELFEPLPLMAVRVGTEQMVRDAGRRDIRAMVMRPPMIYGHGGSAQIPLIFSAVAKTGTACYIGKGANVYAFVHVDDLARLYMLAIEKGTSGAVYHATAGEVSFREIAEAVAEVMHCPVRSVSLEEAAEIWDPHIANVVLGACSRSRTERSRRELGWIPQHTDVLSEIRHGSYRERFQSVT